MPWLLNQLTVDSNVKMTNSCTVLWCLVQFAWHFSYRMIWLAWGFVQHNCTVWLVPLDSSYDKALECHQLVSSIQPFGLWSHCSIAAQSTSNAPSTFYAIHQSIFRPNSVAYSYSPEFFLRYNRIYLISFQSTYSHLNKSLSWNPHDLNSTVGSSLQLLLLTIYSDEIKFAA